MIARLLPRQVTNSEAHDGVLDAIIDIPESLVIQALCSSSQLPIC